MSKRKPDAEKFRKTLFAYLEEKYDLNITNDRLDDGNSRDMKIRVHHGVENLIKAANEMVRRAKALPPSDAKRGNTRHYYKQFVKENKA